MTEALVREAQRLHRLGRVPEAIHAYKQALAQDPKLAQCWFNLAVLLRQQRQITEALAAYQRALDYGIASPEEVHLNRGVIYSDFLRQDAAAEQELNRALELNTHYVPALLNLANLHEDLGRREEAGRLYERILTLDPRCLEALARYANLQPAASADDRLIAGLQEALRIRATAAEHASVLFALGRLLDGKRHFAAAFEAYTAANEKSRASAGPGAPIYNPRQQEDLIERLILNQRAASSQAAAPAQTGVHAKPAALDDSRPEPIFICGMFRSGSTLTEHLLAGHSQVVAGGELDLLKRLGTAVPTPEALAAASPDLIASLADAYRDELQRMFPGARYVTDKRPDNFLRIGLIKRIFPHARIVHTTRDPLDNCVSIFFLHLDHSMTYAFNLMDIGHYFRQYRRLMSHWQALYSGDLHEFHYDSFVRQPAREASRLFDFLGLEWDDRYLDTQSRRRSVRTASVWQVREPIYTRSSGRAAHYSTQLRALREYLSDLLPK